MLNILHIHGFECAGSTFAAILRANYGRRFTHVEPEGVVDRLPWQILSEMPEFPSLDAVSSHLVPVPMTPQSIARQLVSFVRAPRERICSAYLFESRLPDARLEKTTFEDYVGAMPTSILSNYQTRILSPQDDGGWYRQQGWELRPDLIAWTRNDMLVGVVERFDESLVVLEWQLERLGIEFDAAYAEPLNANPITDHSLSAVPRQVVELDETLYTLANRELDRRISCIPDFVDRLRNFYCRCDHERAHGMSMSIVAPKEWIVVDPSHRRERLVSRQDPPDQYVARLG